MKSVYIYLIFLLMLMFSCVKAHAGGNDYRIMKLSHADGVTIDGVAAKKVKTFSKKSVIKWGKDDAAAMLVKEIATSRLYRFSKRQMESKKSKRRIETLEQFFLRTNKASTRATADEVALTVKRCGNRFSFAERRIALIIGNTTYSSLPTLLNPQNDVAAVTDKLLSLGFDVVEEYDCNYTDFRLILEQFEELVNQDNYQIVFFYYAGHGIQKDGKNYLIPISATLQKPSDIDSCVSCDEILHSLEKTTSSSRIVIFDACRNTNSALTDNEHKGLAQIQQLEPGTMLIYSTGYGQVASDGDGEHSPFAHALLNNIGTPATVFEIEMKAVANETYRQSGETQYPAISGSLKDYLVLKPEATNDSKGNNMYESYKDRGLTAMKEFRYSDANLFFENAQRINNTEDIKEHIKIVNDSIDSTYYRAIRLFNKKSIKNKEQAYVLFMRLLNTKRESLAYIGNCHEAMGNYSLAIKSYKDGIAKSEPLAAYLCANLLRKTDYKKSTNKRIELYKMASLSVYESLDSLGIEYERLEKYDSAYYWYKQSNTIFSKYKRACLLLDYKSSNTLIKIKGNDDAFKLLEDIADSYSEAAYYLGMLYLNRPHNKNDQISLKGWNLIKKAADRGHLKAKKIYKEKDKIDA